MAFIEATDVRKEFERDGKPFIALNRVSLSVEEGEFVCLLGPSGCGKTTLLSAIAGFEHPDSGTVCIEGKPVEHPSPHYVTIFQQYGLLPWQTVEKNVALGLRAQGVPRDEARQTADAYLRLVGLEALKHNRPAQLSGGQQQRVSIARALAVHPKALFMDEPFAALDAITRLKMQDDIHRIAREQHVTVLFVTHDIDEAVVLADRIVVMAANPGRVKAIVPVELGEHRDRTADDFLRVRDRVFDLFEMKHDNPIEYVI